MQKTKILAITVLTTLTVGIINSASAFVAYNLIVPEEKTSETLISDESSVNQVLPEPLQNQPVDVTGSSATSKTATGGTVELRETNDKLVAGQKPKPAKVIKDSNGNTVYKWCSGSNPELPDEVCQAVVSIVANPSTSNPHLGEKAKQSLSLLPSDSSLVMDEDSWESTGDSSGTMMINADTSEYGTIKLKIFLQKQGDIWVVTDGQLA